MSRGFENKKAMIYCGYRGRTRHRPNFGRERLFTVPDYPLDGESWVSDPHKRARREEASRRAFELLEAAPLPFGWLALTGCSGNAIEFCSLRCARLWIAAREREGVS